MYASNEAVSIIIPAYNEESGICEVIKNLKKVINQTQFAYEIIVIDDGSSDQTYKVAKKEGVHVLSHKRNKGYGASLKTGIAAAEHELILITDADGTYPVKQIPQMLKELKYADMVVGSRAGQKVNISLLRRFAKWILSKLAEHISGEHIPDLNSGQRAFRSQYIKQYFSILPDRFSFTTTLTIAMLSDNYKIKYLPIDYYERVGKSKILPWNFMDFIILILRMAMFFQPLKVFLPTAIVCFTLGSFKFLFDIISLFQRSEGISWKLFFQPAISTSAVLLLLVGLQLILIGMVADGLLRRISRANKPLLPSQAILNPYYSTDKRTKDG